MKLAVNGYQGAGARPDSFVNRPVRFQCYFSSVILNAMKHIVIPIVTALAGAAGGFLFGQESGASSARSAAAFQQMMKSADDLRAELQAKEAEDITKYIHGKASIESRDEGGLFNVRMVSYMTGHVENSASVAKAKDVRIRIDFKSKTGSVIGSKELTIYEFIAPGHSVEFKERVDVPEKVESYEWTVLSATPS